MEFRKGGIMKQGTLESKERKLDFGTIRRDGDLFGEERTKTIVLTVFSNTEWILLAKPNTSDSFFSSLFTEESSPLRYCVKTKGCRNGNKYYPFVLDDFIIIASGDKTVNEGQEVEIRIRLNTNGAMASGNYDASIDFVLLTKERYMQKTNALPQELCSCS
jgi:hypothetical protein